MSAPAGKTRAAWRRFADTVVSSIARLIRPVAVRRGLPMPDNPQRLAIVAALIAVAFVLGMFFVDAPLIDATRYLPHLVIWFFNEITDFGKSGWFLWPLGILFLALAALPRHLTRVSQSVLAAVMVRVGFLFVAIGAPGLFVTIVKRMIGRARPMVTGIADPFVFDPFRWTAAYASLPSGHTTTAFSVLVAFGSLWPRARAVLLIYAFLIAASRVIVTAHYPTDAVAGALVGFGGALLVRRWFALQRLGFSIGPDGQLHQLPGPSLKRIKSVARELLA